MTRKDLSTWSEAYGRFRMAEAEELACQLRGERVPPELAARVVQLRAAADELFERAQQVILAPTSTPSCWAELVG